MAELPDYDKIISTVNSLTSDVSYTFIPDENNVLCIDTSNFRIGINTLDPSYSIHVSGGDIKTRDLILDNSNGLIIRNNVGIELNVGRKINDIIKAIYDICNNSSEILNDLPYIN